MSQLEADSEPLRFLRIQRPFVEWDVKRYTLAHSKTIYTEFQDFSTAFQDCSCFPGLEALKILHTIKFKDLMTVNPITGHLLLWLSSSSVNHL